MAYHVASDYEFAYEPEHITCSLTFYSDVLNSNRNGQLVTTVHCDPSAFKIRVSSCDISSFYLDDLIALLNIGEDGYKESTKRHKKATGDLNLIDYDELRQSFGYVDNLSKMSNRLQILGSSAFSILNDDRKLNTGVCIHGQITDPDRLFIPGPNFIDGKIHTEAIVADYLVLGSRNQMSQFDTRTYRYAQSGSIIYLLIYIRRGVFHYLVYLSEESIYNLIRAILEIAELDSSFDFIYTVIGRTNTEEESQPYLLTSEGVFLKSTILYSNETQFSSPVLSTRQGFLKAAKAIRSKDSVDRWKSSTGNLEILPLLSSLFHKDFKKDYNQADVLLFDALIRSHENTDLLIRMYDIHWTENSLDLSQDHLISSPRDSAFKIGYNFIKKNLSYLNLPSLLAFINQWEELTGHESIRGLKTEISEFIKEKEELIYKVTTVPAKELSFDDLDDDYEIYS